MMRMAMLVGALALLGCKGEGGGSGGEAKGGEAPAPAKKSSSCTVFVAKKVSGEFKGTANGEVEADVKEAAWKDVCAKLPAADQPNCRDDKKFLAAESGGSVTMNGKTSFNTNITLSPRSEQVEGKGTSETDVKDACQKALLDACAKAGGTGDCVASGEFEKKGEMTKSGNL